MIERSHPKLSAGTHCRLLSILRSSFYYELRGETAMNLDLMSLTDKQFLEAPLFGVRQMTWRLQNEGHPVNQKRIRRLMRLMRLMPIYQEPDTSKPAKGRKTCPYPLGGLRAGRTDQVWCADITYLPMRRGFLYLVAIMDWFTRKMLAWRISNTLEADFCVEALNEAIHRVRSSGATTGLTTPSTGQRSTEPATPHHRGAPAPGERRHRRSEKAAPCGTAPVLAREGRSYLILPSLYSTCSRFTGSYFRTTIFSVMVRAFFLVT